MSDDTLFLRLAGPMQSWGTSSRLQIRRTDAYPSKSGVLGLLLCAKGVGREDSATELQPLVTLVMGVRVDREGTLDWDYHTAGGGHGDGADRAVGIRSAEGRVKKTASTGRYETLLSRRQYLYDASFLVALRGDPATVRACATALEDPVWPIFLGRKCCVAAEPVFAGSGTFTSLTEALTAVPWRPRIRSIDGTGRSRSCALDAIIEHPEGSPPPAHARLVYDVPRALGHHNHGPRWITAAQVTVPVGEPLHPPAALRGWRDPYGPEWDDLKIRRLTLDQGLCVFCKSPADAVHHLDYADVRVETLRSVCELCHDACTALEYGNDMHRRRIDPSDPGQRPAILRQVALILTQRRGGRQRELLEDARKAAGDFFEESTGP